ncbi:UNC93-like protein MFSD11 [Paramacrobiotus metropolitanus]|uniref:UNC93-like protein MFSD11 n=1 Tax=Paramacrobiotus metropolitanus TaxID=2943436 RepID=UPI002445ED06|nr:UNC93-like protein MFSD11 [Paramacrobiotus metropolitanus]
MLSPKDVVEQSSKRDVPPASPVWRFPANLMSASPSLPRKETTIEQGDNSIAVVAPVTERCCNQHMCNIILLGLGFFFCMGSFFTCMFSQTVVLNSVHDEYFEGTPTMGYVCLAISFAAMTVSFVLSPALSAVMGPKTSMVIGAGFLTLSIGVFLRPLEITLYMGSLAQGIGAGIMWTVYGHFLTANSTAKTIGRNTGIFWMLFQAGPVCGNLFYFVLTNNASSITDTTRYILFSVLLPASSLGIFTLSLLRHPWVHDTLSVKTCDQSEEKEERLTFGQALQGELKMAMSKEMLLLTPMFVYMGIELTFWMNVYGTSLGYTFSFGSVREALVGLNGMFIGFGQITGGFCYGLLGGFLRRNGRDVGVLLAFVTHLVAFYIAFLILPERSALEMTAARGHIAASPYIALVCSFLLGFGDAGWNNPLFALFGSLYPKDPVSAFAIFQAYQSFGNVISFAYSTTLIVPYQLGIMVITAVLGLFGYCFVEWKLASDEAKLAMMKKKLAEQMIAFQLSDPKPWSSKEAQIISNVLSSNK